MLPVSLSSPLTPHTAPPGAHLQLSQLEQALLQIQSEARAVVRCFNPFASHPT